jgi:hypothetical protein
MSVDITEALKATVWLAERYGCDDEIRNLTVERLCGLVDAVDQAAVQAVKSFVSDAPTAVQTPTAANHEHAAIARSVAAAVERALSGATLGQAERETIGQTVNVLTTVLAEGY